MSSTHVILRYAPLVFKFIRPLLKYDHEEGWSCDMMSCHMTQLVLNNTYHTFVLSVTCKICVRNCVRLKVMVDKAVAD